MTERPAILCYFAFDRLSTRLAQISEPFQGLAHTMADWLLPGPS
ncbi:hypothetical protein ACFQ9J_13905 [Streptomyces sp. NPDC056529]